MNIILRQSQPRQQTERAASATGKPTPPTNTSTEVAKIKECAEFCRRARDRILQAYIETGQQLAKLRAELASEKKWIRAFGEGKGRVRETDNPFPFDSRTAERLIQIYERLGQLPQPEKLPSSFSALTELARLTPQRLVEVLPNVNASSTAAEIKAITKPKPTPKQEPPAGATKSNGATQTTTTAITATKADVAAASPDQSVPKKPKPTNEDTVGTANLSLAQRFAELFRDVKAAKVSAATLIGTGALNLDLKELQWLAKFVAILVREFKEASRQHGVRPRGQRHSEAPSK